MNSHSESCTCAARASRRRWPTLLLGAALALPGWVAAVTVPNAFEDGTVASAEAVNENFDTLGTAVTKLEGAVHGITYLREQRNDGVNITTSTGFARRGMTHVAGSGSGVTLNGDGTFTLAEGSYDLLSTCVAPYIAQNFVCWVRRVGGAPVASGLPAYSNGSAGNSTSMGLIVVPAGGATYELVMHAEAASSLDANQFDGQPEYFSQIRLQKLQ